MGIKTTKVVRKSDSVRVSHLHKIAPRPARTDESWRRKVWAKLREIEADGGYVIETASGRDSRNPSERDAMLEDMVEYVTNKNKSPYADISRANGAKSAGRPRRQDMEDKRAEASANWFNPDLRGSELAAKQRKLGWSLSRCYEIFGPRQGREK